MKKIILTGGGTAGHVYPALALVNDLAKEYEIHYFGGNGMEKDILKKHQSIIYHEIPVVKFERKLTLRNLMLPFKLISSIKQTKKEIKKVKPNIVFSKGGFVSVPVAISAHKLKIPVISHESDLSLGLANKVILRYCECMCTTYPETAKRKKCIYTGQPIRKKILNGKKLAIKSDLPFLLILGGSSGASFLNNIVYENLDDLSKHFYILHIYGKNGKEVKHKNYYGVAYTERIEDFYTTADVVLSRAGSGVINELKMLNLPMLLIPLSKKISRGDQIENAKYFEKHGYAKCLEEEEAGYLKIKEILLDLLKNKGKTVKNLKKIEKIDANEQIFELIKKYEL